VIEFLTANWLWIAFVVFFVAMHRGGHGCGMHGHHQHQSRETDTEHAPPTRGGRTTS
jgi:hypothetical protein